MICLSDLLAFPDQKVIIDLWLNLEGGKKLRKSHHLEDVLAIPVIAEKITNLGLILADMEERMMTPAAVLLEAVSAQDFFVARTRTNPELETGKLFEFYGKFKLSFVVWIFARFLRFRSRFLRSEDESGTGNR